MESVTRVYQSMPPAVFAELRRVVGAALQDMAAALPANTVMPAPQPPGSQLVAPVAAAVAAVREHVHASPDARSDTSCFLLQQMERRLPDSALDEDQGKGGLAMSGVWDDMHTATDSLLGVWLRTKPVGDTAAAGPGQQRIAELLQAQQVADDGASDGSGAAFARSEEVLALIADELQDVPRMYARARVLTLLLNLSDLCVALEELRQCIVAFTSMLPRY